MPQGPMIDFPCQSVHQIPKAQSYIAESKRHCGKRVAIQMHVQFFTMASQLSHAAIVTDLGKYITNLTFDESK